MYVKDIITVIEQAAPLVYQEGYDNSGLQVGDRDAKVKGILLCLDVTEAIVGEAMERGCNMIVAHHPLIFSGLKSISGRNYVERVVRMAIKNDIHIYAAHTNLDNMHDGVNAKIAQKLGLKDLKILSPRTDTISKLYTYAPADVADKVREAMFAAGGGNIGRYKECSFNVEGNGSFRPAADAKPAIGEAGGKREWVKEVKIELIVEKHFEKAVLKALIDSHPYEEVAYELIRLPNGNQEIGAGMVGRLEQPVGEAEFLAFVKERMRTGCIKHTALTGQSIEKVAICGGSGSFLLPEAIKAKADIFITSDYKYHQFFDAEGQIVIADIGHYESEQYTPEIFAALLNEKFPNFAILLSNLSTNPVKYFC